jgi:cephalosporin-C deacetylase-like acetyl esterase
VRPSASGKFPGVCIYHGYSGRAPRPLDMLALAAQGICVLSMDCRGQNGQSQDTAVYLEGHQSGWMTQGIRDPRTYYYRYVYADAVRALDLLARREEVDEKRLAITGASQGGGITLAVAALSERPRMAFSRRQLVDVVWGETWVGDEHLVDVHIGHLRHKLGDDASEPRFIRTVRGVGYRMGTGE